MIGQGKSMCKNYMNSVGSELRMLMPKHEALSLKTKALKPKTLNPKPLNPEP